MEAFRLLSIMICLFNLHNFAASYVLPSDTVHYVEPGKVIANNKPGLQIFCHRAKSKYLPHIWRTIMMNLDTNIDSYDIYDGKNPQEVFDKHEDNQRSWKFNFFGSKKHKFLKINPFEDTCIGVYTYDHNNSQYTISITQIRIDIWKVLMTVIGIILFWFAKRLSHNPLFYYLCGISLGVTASLIILIYFASKLLPRGKVMYLMVATGWTMSFYLAQLLWENAQLIILQYKDYVMWYILVTSLISFVICYRFGPVTNRRTKHIIQWFLQGLGLILIYYSSYFREASFLGSIILLVLYNFPLTLVHKGKKYWRNMFPEKRKLLTEEQYREEAIIETRKAMAGLKEYCSSPECNTWKIVLRLKDPIRFAKFMERNSHISDDELKEHDLEITKLVDNYDYDDNDEYDYNAYDEYVEPAVYAPYKESPLSHYVESMKHNNDSD